MVELSNFLLWLVVASGFLTGILVFQVTREISLAASLTLVSALGLTFASGFVSMLIGYIINVGAMESLDLYGVYGMAGMLIAYWFLAFRISKTQLLRMMMKPKN